MEPSRKSHAIELSLYMWRNDYTQLGAATINHLHASVTAFVFGYSGTSICGLTLRYPRYILPTENAQAGTAAEVQPK